MEFLITILLTLSLFLSLVLLYAGKMQTEELKKKQDTLAAKLNDIHLKVSWSTRMIHIMYIGLLEANLEKLIQDERYEEAATLRQLIIKEKSKLK